MDVFEMDRYDLVAARGKARGNGAQSWYFVRGRQTIQMRWSAFSRRVYLR